MGRGALVTIFVAVGLLIAGCANQGPASVPSTPGPSETRKATPSPTSMPTPSPTSAATPSETPKAMPSETPTASPRVLWPAPPNPMALARAAGLVPETRESMTFHVHAHLDIFQDGVPVVVPAGIGIDVTNPGVQHGTLPDGSEVYGGIAGCDKPCISPLHTHDSHGVLHTESTTPKPNTLGQFFTEWDVTLTANCIGQFCRPATPITFYLDGKPYPADPATIQLTDQLEIAIVIGTPPAVIPSVFSGG